MKCSHCGFESDGRALAGECSLCGFFGATGTYSASLVDEIAPWEAESAWQNPLSVLTVSFRNSFFSSKRFFSTIARNPKLIPALIYGMVFGSAGTCLTALWSNFPSLSPDALFRTAAIMGGSSEDASPERLIATPIILFAQFFFLALYVHGMLFITRSSKKSFCITLKTICYAEGAMIFLAIPVFGPLISVLAWLYLIVSGVQSVHEISGKRAILVLTLPLLFFFIVIVIVGMLAVLAADMLSGAHIDPFSLFKNR